jgi:hypothetical protein
METKVVTGSRGAYFWLTALHHDMSWLFHICPQLLLGKYIAVTSFDSGSLILTDEEKRAGWENRNEIAYSPLIESIQGLPESKCAGFDEWYIFESSSDLGQLSDANVFEAPLAPGQVFTFVNFLGFALHNPEVKELVGLFWRQIDWIQPESYIADGEAFLTVVSRDKNLFNAVRQALNRTLPSV